MRIAILSPHLGNPWPNTGDGFIALGLARLLGGHELVWLPLHRAPTPAERDLLRTCDGVVVGGSNLVGSQGTVRMAYGARELASLGVPVIPMAVGAQAPLGGSPRVDREGRRMLDLWADGGPMSVRDELTRDFLAGLYGGDRVVLTGCSALWLEAPRPGPAPGGDMLCVGPLFTSGGLVDTLRFWGLMRLCLRRSGGAPEPEVVGQQAESLHYERVLGRPVTFFGADYERALCAFASARTLVTARIHPAVVAARHGVPTVLLAVDERCRSLAALSGIPVLDWDRRVRAEDWSARVAAALAAYDSSVVGRRMAQQRAAMSSFLTDRGLAAPSAVPRLPCDPTAQGRPGWLTSYAVALSKSAPRLAASLMPAARLLIR
ncbi:MAG: Polysaccharide pyruvyl transferase [Pseudomonadota bacterium]|jgi:hypothetical protein